MFSMKGTDIELSRWVGLWWYNQSWLSCRPSEAGERSPDLQIAEAPQHWWVQSVEPPDWVIDHGRLTQCENRITLLKIVFTMFQRISYYWIHSLHMLHVSATYKLQFNLNIADASLSWIAVRCFAKRGGDTWDAAAPRRQCHWVGSFPAYCCGPHHPVPSCLSLRWRHMTTISQACWWNNSWK